MPAPTIIRGSDYMFSTTYEGNGGGQKVGKFVPFTDNGTIAKSVIFNDGDSPQLSKTPSGAGNRRTFTFSVWLKRGELTGAEQYILSASNSASSTKYDFIYFDTDNCIRIQHHNGSSVEGQLKTNRTFEDCTKWYHLVYRCDTTQSTATDRMRLYIDGDEVTSFSIDTNPSQNYDTDVNDATLQSLGKPGWHDGVYFDGYMAEVNLADGTSYGPDTFGITDTSTGRWIPKSLGSITYGTNGYRLTFANSAGQTIGDDTSGNGNDYAVSNIAVSDLTTDSPTQNHNTVEPLVNPGSDTLSEGNLKTVGGSSTYSYTVGTMKLKKGKYYAEFKVTAGGGNATQIGIAGRHSTGSTNHLGYNPTTYSYYYGGQVYLGLSTNSATSWGNSYTDNDYVGVALDLDNNKLYFAKNNTWQNSSNPVTGANAIGIIPPEETQFGGYAFAVGNFEGAGGPTVEHNYGQKSFQYTPPDGYVAVQQDNFPETGKGIPDFVWIKNRDATDDYQMYDSSRGVKQKLTTEAGAESTVEDGLQKFLKGGFAVEDDVSVNTSGESYVAWNWVANGGTTAANTDGSGASIASTTQANQTAGFSIVTYTGSGSAGTIAHGLSSAPEWVMASRRNDSSGDGWTTYHSAMTDANYWMDTRQSNGQNSASTVWNGTAPTNKVFSVGTASGTNTSSKTYVALCWHSVSGFSKFGKYTANNSADGPIIYTGFKPSWLLIKALGAISWYIIDATRSTINPVTAGVTLDNSQVEFTNQFTIDFLSNGFKIRNGNGGSGASTNHTSYDPYIYCAFAEHPFVGSGTNPVTAR